MPLFHNWPYVNLSELNLNWIISKIKNIDETEKTVTELSVNLPAYAETAANAAQAATEAAAAANQINDHLEDIQDDVETWGTRAEAAATTATNAANAAANNAEQAYNSRVAASESATAAGNSATAASGSATAASGSATAAGNSATQAEAAATRAETAASSEGFTGTGGLITPQTSATWELLPGRYLLTYRCATASENNSGIFFITYDGTVFGNTWITFNGSTLVVTVTCVDGVLRIRNSSSVNMNWFLMGYNMGE